MTSPTFRATPEQLDARLRQLRARVEALEATQQKIRFGPESPLVERVARLIARFASEGLPGDDATPTARAAILEVAA